MAIQTLNTIKNWFKTNLKPTQSQFWDTWDSFRHKNEKVPVEDLDGIDELLFTKASKSDFKTINGETIIGSGDISSHGGDSQDLQQTFENGSNVQVFDSTDTNYYAVSFYASPEETNSAFDQYFDDGYGSKRSVIVQSNGNFELHQYNGGIGATRIEFETPVESDVLLKFPAKLMGTYTLGTTSDITLQKIIDNNGGYAEVTDSNSYIDILNGSEGNRRFIASMYGIDDDALTTSNIEVTKTNAQLTSIIEDGFASRVAVVLGKLEISTSANGFKTTLRIAEPTDFNTLIFPDKGGTLAITDDITLQKLAGTELNLDEGNNNFQFFTGLENDRNFVVNIGDGADKVSDLILLNDSVHISNESSDGTGKFEVDGGVTTFSQSNEGLKTTIGFDTPIATGSGAFINFPALAEGNYIIATTADIPTPVGLTEVTAVQNTTPSSIEVQGVKIGSNSPSAIQIGDTTVGTLNTGEQVIQIGNSSGNSNTGDFAVQIGFGVGNSNEGQKVVQIGTGVGSLNTGNYAVQIGEGAGSANTGDNVIQIGVGGGDSNTFSNVIELSTTAINGDLTPRSDNQFIIRTVDSKSIIFDTNVNNQNLLQYPDKADGLFHRLAVLEDIPIIYSDSATTPHTITSLNATYPTAKKGDKVECLDPAIMLIYEKSATSWFKYSINTVSP
jgi:hypothetical protein